MVGDIATKMTNDGIGQIDVVRYWPHWIGWQTDPNQESRYRLFSASDLADGVTPIRAGGADDFLSEDRDSFDFDAPQSSTPTSVIQSSDAYLRDPNKGYATVTGANPLHNNWNNLGYVRQDGNIWEVADGTPVTVTDRDSGPSGAVIEIEHANDGTRIGWTNMGNLY